MWRGRQRFQIGGYRSEIIIVQMLSAMYDHIAHGTANHTVRHAVPIFKQIDQLLSRPSAQTRGVVAAQVHGTPAVLNLATGQIVTPGLIQRFFLQRERTRRMAATAMTQSLY